MFKDMDLKNMEKKIKAATEAFKAIQGVHNIEKLGVKVDIWSKREKEAQLVRTVEEILKLAKMFRDDGLEEDEN